MRRFTGFVGILVMAAALGAGCPSQEPEPKQEQKKDMDMEQPTGNPVVVIETSMGTIKAELWAKEAPATVANFLGYVDRKFYDGLIFHRVIKGFMAQGGGFDANMQKKPTGPPIKNEATAALRNDAGTLAMARTQDVDSATAQFYINLENNTFLNHKDETAAGFGYCAFGRVIEGMDVVRKIGKVKTGIASGMKDVPVKTVEIKSIRRAE